MRPVFQQKPQLPGDTDAGTNDAGGFVIDTPSFGSTGGGGASTAAGVNTSYKPDKKDS